MSESCSNPSSILEDALVGGEEMEGVGLLPVAVVVVVVVVAVSFL